MTAEHLSDADTVLTATDAGIVVRGALELDAAHDVLINGHPVLSLLPAKDMQSGADGRALAWPAALKPYLHGTAFIELVMHDVPGTVASCQVSLGDARPEPVVVRDHQGNGLVLDKWGRLIRPLGHESDEDLQHLLDMMTQLVEDLRTHCDVSAFVCFGTLLGAVRDESFIGHDNDVDLAYLSVHTHPVDIVRESYGIERCLMANGWKVRRGSAVRLNVRVRMPSGLMRFIDVFTFSEVEGELYMPSDVAVELPRKAMLPPSTVRLYDRAFPAPADSERMLKSVYGPGWRAPDPSFRYEPPSQLRRRYDGWYGGLHPHRKHWDHFARTHTLRIPLGPTAFAGWVTSQAELADRLIVDVGSGTGRDTLHFARSGRPALGLDYVARWLIAARRQANDLELPAEFRLFDLSDIRATLTLGHELADTACDLYARLLLSSISAETRSNLWRLARMASRGGARLYLEFRTLEDAERPHVFEGEGPPRRFLSADAIADEIAEFGGVVESSVQGTGMAPFESEDPHVCRMTVTWHGGGDG